MLILLIHWLTTTFNDSVLNILKELRFESPPKNRAKRTKLNVEPGKSVGVSTTSESENEVDSPDVMVNKNESSTESTENQINIDTPEVPEIDMVSSNIKTIQINNIINVIENVYNIEKSDWWLATS